MDNETRELLNRLTERLDDIKKVKGAVAQLETVVNGWPRHLEDKLAAVRAASWDRNGRYRGVFASEDDARCFGLFVMAATGNHKAELALSGEMKSVYGRAMGDTASTGSGLVPIEYSNRIQRLVEAFGTWAGKAFPAPMTSDSQTFQRRTSGFAVYKTGDNVPATASELGFDTINLNADEWNVLCLYPNAWAEDAGVAIVGELMAMEIGQSFAYQTDYCGLVGDGTPESLGVMGLTTKLIGINGVDDGGGLTIASGNTWGEIVEADILKLIGSVPAYAGAMNEFYASNPFIWQVLHKLALNKGGVQLAEVRGEQRLMVYGYPINPVQVMQKTEANSSIPLLYGDIRLSSTHGKRAELKIDESKHVKFLERQTAVLGTQRHAVANHTLGDATNAGPVVGLILAGS